KTPLLVRPDILLIISQPTIQLMPNTYNAADITEALMLFADKKQREILMKFFKTGKGEYGHGDQFLGIGMYASRVGAF
ncbi:MAG: hypothetical protein MSH66_02985, partial [Bacteroidales bacterium]|nr:hypothetical protein [Bacteroidales bacterium]